MYKLFTLGLLALLLLSACVTAEPQPQEAVASPFQETKAEGLPMVTVYRSPT